MKNTYIFIATLALVFISCEKKVQDVVDLKDLTTYLQTQENDASERIHTNLSFWEEKLVKNPNQFPYGAKIAGLETQLFSKTGDIQHLKKAENLLVLAVEKSGGKQSGYLRSLARNYISQHQFKKALELLQKAEMNGDQKQETIKMMFDVNLELGKEKIAYEYLRKIENKRSFDYLIRIAKWKDHKGDLEATISYMEEALAGAQKKEYEELELWCITNLADYYGHHGDIEKSYKYYLKTLEKDPNNHYALKKIAWISFSNDKDILEAKKILKVLDERYKGVDVDLFAYEIATYEYKEVSEKLTQYWSKVKDAKYGEMYNKYNFDILIDTKNYKEAYQTALREVNNRPTAASYSMLALATACFKDPYEGMHILKTNQVVESYEPEVLLRVAKVYEMNERRDALEIIKQELLEASFELGPVKTNQVLKL
ncbi:lipopolysaccharide assembly protein LapB [Wenyingzhuangia sp. 2_MG-2023]|uniref:tetratricopeptide repeat protein n=1 Tax=Wenyingzhuangia sp. 2_MG-2023 TaxID=3062639 RepID=UPI0026E19D9B|nr:cell surface protein [Wenyingzhuangia sp. 2_MG-2023]MDO6736585.1 cell surface protein [Wenyingzhuangia sp. 2_MG-2023]